MSGLLSCDTADDSLPNSLLAYTAPADVLLDRVQLGIEILLPMLTPGDAQAFCRQLRKVGIIDTSPRRDQLLKSFLSVSFAVPDLLEGGQMTIVGKLALREANDGSLVITNQSHLLPGLLRALRSQLPEPGEPATGGATNVVGPHGPDWQHLLGLELSNLAQGIDAFVAAVATAAAATARTEPVSLRGRVWVQQCEICRDLAYADAEAIVRDMATCPLPGAGEQVVRPIQEDDGNRLLVRWSEGHANSPERKVYAKRPDLLRTEVTLSGREAVLALLRRQEVARPPEFDLSGASAMAALAAVAEAAAPLLDGIGAAVEELDNVYSLAGTEFVLGLLPLLRLLDTAPRPASAPGRPVDAILSVEARRALERLIRLGRYRTTSRGTPDKLREALREMEKNGLLRRLYDRPITFGVRPEFAAVRQALAAARHRDDLAEDAEQA